MSRSTRGRFASSPAGKPAGYEMQAPAGLCKSGFVAPFRGGMIRLIGMGLELCNPYP